MRLSSDRMGQQISPQNQKLNILEKIETGTLGADGFILTRTGFYRLRERFMLKRSERSMGIIAAVASQINRMSSKDKFTRTLPVDVVVGRWTLQKRLFPIVSGNRSKKQTVLSFMAVQLYVLYPKAQ